MDYWHYFGIPDATPVTDFLVLAAGLFAAGALLALLVKAVFGWPRD